MPRKQCIVENTLRVCVWWTLSQNIVERDCLCANVMHTAFRTHELMWETIFLKYTHLNQFLMMANVCARRMILVFMFFSAFRCDTKTIFLSWMSQECPANLCHVANDEIELSLLHAAAWLNVWCWNCSWPEHVNDLICKHNHNITIIQLWCSNYLLRTHKLPLALTLYESTRV